MTQHAAASTRPATTRRAWLTQCLSGSLKLGSAGVALAGALPLSAQAGGYNFWLGEYTVDKPDLDKELRKRFPMQFQYAQLFSVQLSNPQLGLNAPANRASVTCDVQIGNPLLLPTPVRGVLAVSSQLKFDAATNALRLVEPRAEQVKLAGLGQEEARQLQAVGEIFASQVLNDYALYTFKPEDLMYNGQSLIPGAITVLDQGIKVKVELG